LKPPQNDLRLRRVHKTMVGFGDRLQYSVFECRTIRKRRRMDITFRA
jgi:CRISPR/Cas system-associated endoribonuclease Cas2